MVKDQVSVYYVSKVHAKFEMNYLKCEKYFYALVVFTRNLHPYLHTNEIIVPT